MNSPTFIIAISALFAVATTAAIRCENQTQARRSQLCERRGGIYVDTGRGHVCMAPGALR